VRRAVTQGLCLRGVAGLTAQEDGTSELDEPQLLDRATELGRVLFTPDDHLRREAKRRQPINKPFAGLIDAHPLNSPIGPCIADLEWRR
jgi:hypothetical protein